MFCPEIKCLKWLMRFFRLCLAKCLIHLIRSVWASGSSHNVNEHAWLFFLSFILWIECEFEHSIWMVTSVLYSFGSFSRGSFLRYYQPFTKPFAFHIPPVPMLFSQWAFLRSALCFFALCFLLFSICVFVYNCYCFLLRFRSQFRFSLLF